MWPFGKKGSSPSDKRTILFVNPRFQTRFSLYVCSWIFPLSLVYPAVFYALFDFFFEFSKYYTPSESVISLKQTRNEILSFIVALQAVFMALVFFISVYVSHKIAGPLYKLHQAFSLARDGKWNAKLKFRKADHFQELADDFSSISDQVQLERSQVRESVMAAITQMEKGNQADRDVVLAELRKVRDRLA
jgi:nitrogen fixation/metabolism regulation signal transduction histidine kinase